MLNGEGREAFQSRDSSRLPCSLSLWSKSGRSFVETSHNPGLYKQLIGIALGTTDPHTGSCPSEEHRPGRLDDLRAARERQCGPLEASVSS